LVFKNLLRLFILSMCLIAVVGCSESFTFNPSEITGVKAQKHSSKDGGIDLSEDQVAIFLKAVKKAKKVTEGVSTTIGSSDELVLTEKSGKQTALQVFYFDSYTLFSDGEFDYKTTGESADELITLWKQLGLQK